MTVARSPRLAVRSEANNRVPPNVAWKARVFVVDKTAGKKVASLTVFGDSVDVVEHVRREGVKAIPRGGRFECTDPELLFLRHGHLGKKYALDLMFLDPPEDTSHDAVAVDWDSEEPRQ